MITRKDLRKDAAKGIDKAACSGIWTCAALLKAGGLACDVYPARGKESETSVHMWICQKQQYAVIRKQFVTKKEEEHLIKIIAIHTDYAALPEKRGAHRLEGRTQERR